MRAEFTRVFSVTYLEGPVGAYSKITVDYFGERAGVRFDFTKAVHSTGQRHEKDRTVTFDVVTMGEQFDMKRLDDKILQLTKKGGALGDLGVLHFGLEQLKDFIAKNGADNPYEAYSSATEWECVPA